MSIAWHGESLARRKYLPSLKSVLLSAEKKLAKVTAGWEGVRSFLLARVKKD